MSSIPPEYKKARHRSISHIQASDLPPSRPRTRSITSAVESPVRASKVEVNGSPLAQHTSQDALDSTPESNSDWESQDTYSDDPLEDDEETGLTETDRKKRQQRKRRKTRLDERIVPNTEAAEEAKRLARRAVVKESFVNALLIVLWYSFSIGISVFNKFVLGKDKLDFHFPLFFTSFHMIIQFALSSLVMYFLPQFRPQTSSADTRNYQQIGAAREESSEAQQDPKSKPAMTRFFYLTRIGPCGAATGLDIGLGNMSLKYITLTFYTMCKSSVLGFVLLFAFLFRLEKPSVKLAAIIITMAAGVIMMVAGETAFSALGFVLIMSASFFSGFRWSLTQILLVRNPATSNPFSTIFFLSPVMFLTLVIIAIPAEGPARFAVGFQALSAARGLSQAIGILLFPGLLAFSMTAAEFALLKRTSVVTLSVCGIFKEVLTIIAASTTFGDELTAINLSGLVVTIASIATYNFVKFRGMQEEAKKGAQVELERRTSMRLSIDAQKPYDTPESSSSDSSGRSDGETNASDNQQGARTGSVDRIGPPKRPENLE